MSQAMTVGVCWNLWTAACHAQHDSIVLPCDLTNWYHTPESVHIMLGQHTRTAHAASYQPTNHSWQPRRRIHLELDGATDNARTSHRERLLSKPCSQPRMLTAVSRLMAGDAASRFERDQRAKNKEQRLKLTSHIGSWHSLFCFQPVSSSYKIMKYCGFYNTMI